MNCYECSKKNGHPETGGVHEPFHCKPDLCPDRDKHYQEVYAGRISSKHGNLTRDGVMTYIYIDGKKADTHCDQKRCICGLVLLFTPKVTKNVAP